MDWLGYSHWAYEKDLGICPKHPKELVMGKSVNIEIDGKRVYIPGKPFQAPVNVADKSFSIPTMMSLNGTGTDHELLYHVMQINREEANLSNTT